ncbi:helix-turn-helix domain-containing protein [Gluconacetobacter sacchari]|uniref:helix-turn-helix domain-containing protein n=1 Tax=Gluconacetobacter sacchari TaxID=92759 RepID=UPI0035712914
MRAARKAVRLTQAEAAEVVSVCQATWKKWEAGVHRMPPASFHAFQMTAWNLGGHR